MKPIWHLGYIVNNLCASLTVDSVKKLVCLKDWLISMDWVCEMNNNCDFSNMTDWYRHMASAGA